MVPSTSGSIMFSDRTSTGWPTPGSAPVPRRVEHEHHMSSPAGFQRCPPERDAVDVDARRRASDSTGAARPGALRARTRHHDRDRQWSVASGPDDHRHPVVTDGLDGLLPRIHQDRLVADKVRSSTYHLLQQGVRHVLCNPSEDPGGPAVLPDHDAGDTGEGRAAHLRPTYRRHRLAVPDRPGTRSRACAGTRSGGVTQASPSKLAALQPSTTQGSKPRPGPFAERIQQEVSRPSTHVAAPRRPLPELPRRS